MTTHKPKCLCVFRGRATRQCQRCGTAVRPPRRRGWLYLVGVGPMKTQHQSSAQHKGGGTQGRQTRLPSRQATTTQNTRPTTTPRRHPGQETAPRWHPGNNAPKTFPLLAQWAQATAPSYSKDMSKVHLPPTPVGHGHGHRMTKTPPLHTRGTRVGV
jgi:hypothetical protein